MLTISILLPLIAILLIVLARMKKAKIKLPPGPRGLPILGNLHQLGKRVHLRFHEWAETYGSMFAIKCGTVPVLVLNDKTLMKELLGRMAATGKYQSNVLTMTTWGGSYGLLTSQGKAWLEQKQFCLKVLRQFGFGKLSLMAPMIHQDADDLCSWMEQEQQKNGSVLLTGTINLSVGNVILTMIAGDRAELGKSRLAHLSHEWVKYIQLGINTGLVFLPWLKYIAPGRTGYNGLSKLCKEFQQLIENLFQDHKQSRKEDEPARDIIDAYIDKVESCRDPASTFFGEEGRKHSFSCAAILMIAGTDGTGTTLHWLIYYLCVHTHVQCKLQEEIANTIGSREPCFGDKVRMPYLEAVVLETLRFASQATIGDTVALLEDVNFNGYTLPKGMMIVSNLYHVHYDKTIWGDPEHFRPSRFLEEGSQHLKEFVVAFHPGKRSCPGEWFARDVLFLFVAKLFQKFTFSVSPDVANAQKYLEPLPGFILYPQKLPIIVTTRQV